MNNELFLFCGGKRKYGDAFISKPLITMNNDKSVISNFLSINKNCFKTFNLLVDQDEVSFFEKEVGKHNVRIVPTPNGSTTMSKFKAALGSFDMPVMSFSYPDIFTNENFWNTQVSDFIEVTTTPVRTRFARVYTSPFGNAVKGISPYDTRCPANTHWIFAGLFQGSSQLLRESYGDFKSEQIDGVLEYDFLDFCANKNLLKQRQYYDFWLNADSNRDFEIINKNFSLI